MILKYFDRTMHRLTRDWPLGSSYFTELEAVFGGGGLPERNTAGDVGI